MTLNLGLPPAVEIDVLAELPPEERSFLRTRNVRLQNRYPDGTSSEAYTYSVVERRAMDAVAILLEIDTSDGPLICLRSAVRPALISRVSHTLPLPHDGRVCLWEIPAGLVEADEVGLTGLRRCASREALEELGARIHESEFELLGSPAYPSPGVIGERMYFLHGRSSARPSSPPAGDGSPVEERAEIRFVRLRDAIREIEAGTIEDMKTEVGLVRLARKRGIV